MKRPVKIRNLLAYGVGDFFGGGSFILISLLFIYFLTDIIGLPASIAGLVVMLGKGWDALSDPLMGYISDKTRTRFGRRRIFFLIGIIPITLSFSLLWFPVDFASETVTFFYFVFAYMFFSTVFTMVMVPYSALNAEMSKDYKIRTQLSGARMIFSGFSSLVVGIIPKMVAESFTDPKIGFFVMGIIFSCLFALPWIFVFWGTWEQPIPEREKTSSLPDFFKNFKSILSNRSFRIHLGMYVCAYSAIDIIMANTLYFMIYFFNREYLFPTCAGLMIVTQLASLIFYITIANRYGKGRAFIIGLSIWTVAMLSVLFMSPDTSNTLIIMLFITAGMGMSAGAMIPWAILPSVTDIDELMTGKQRAGVYAGAMTFTRKLVQAMVLFCVGLTLDSIGYVPNVPQSEEVLNRFQLFFSLAPAFCLISGVVFALFFRVTPRTHSRLAEELRRLKKGGNKSDVKDKTRGICEMLTGRSYHELFPPSD